MTFWLHKPQFASSLLTRAPLQVCFHIPDTPGHKSDDKGFFLRPLYSVYLDTVNAYKWQSILAQELKSKASQENMDCTQMP